MLPVSQFGQNFDILLETAEKSFSTKAAEGLSYLGPKGLLEEVSVVGRIKLDPRKVDHQG